MKTSLFIIIALFFLTGCQKDNIDYEITETTTELATIDSDETSTEAEVYLNKKINEAQKEFEIINKFLTIIDKKGKVNVIENFYGVKLDGIIERKDDIYVFTDKFGSKEVIEIEELINFDLR